MNQVLHVGKLGEAIYSSCGRHRYLLNYQWDENKKPVHFIGLNPSSASPDRPDPTLNRCISYSKKWGYGGLFITNLFSFISADPKILKNYDAPFDERTDYWIKKVSGVCDRNILIWGNHGSFQSRNLKVLKYLKNSYCLSTNKNGSPSHLLYLPGNCDLKYYSSTEMF